MLVTVTPGDAEAEPLLPLDQLDLYRLTRSCRTWPSPQNLKKKSNLIFLIMKTIANLYIEKSVS